MGKIDDSCDSCEVCEGDVGPGTEIMARDISEINFVPVVRACEIPKGSGRAFEVGNQEIALFHLGEEYYAISNVCPHQGGALAEGSLCGEEVSCPWHQWRFNVKTGRSPVNAKLRVNSYPVKKQGEWLLVSIPNLA